MNRAVGCGVLVLSACGCASAEHADTRTKEDVYITGSNLPRRVPPTRGEITTISGSEAQELLRKGAVPLPQGPGR
jgi:hypothetical protein